MVASFKKVHLGEKFRSAMGNNSRKKLLLDIMFVLFHKAGKSKLLLTYAQIMHSFMSTFPSTWPRSLRDFLGSFSGASMDLVAMSGADCFLGFGPAVKLATFVFSPVVAFLFFLGAYLLAR